MNTITKTFLILLLVLLSNTPISAQSLDTDLQQLVDDTAIPGMAVGIIKDKELVYEGYFGMANIQSQTPVSEETSFMLASVSKGFTHAAILISVDEGIIQSLNDPINDYLPFEVKHPANSNAVITIYDLMGHTSGIRDNWDEMPYLQSDDDCTPLGEYLENYLMPGGNIFDASLNYWSDGVGNNHYSNIGYALLGYIVEVANEMDFSVYIRQKILDPLCMNNSSFFIDDLDLSKIAMPYDGAGNPLGHFSYSDYPSGRLRASLRDMANYGIAIMGLGTMDSVALLSPNWGTLILANTAGGDQGVATSCSMDKDSGIGVIILVNYAYSDMPGIHGIIQTYIDDFIAESPDELTCHTITGTNDLTVSQFNFLPIPVVNKLTIEGSFNEAQVIIHNISGAIIWQGELPSSNELEIDYLQSGIYTLSLSENGLVKHHERFVKVR